MDCFLAGTTSDPSMRLFRLRTRTLSCLDKRLLAMLAMLKPDCERTNPARVDLGTWKSSSSRMLAKERAVRHGWDMTS